MSLRERKRARTRQALIDAATDLFERNGYDETTIADIAAAAEIGTRTFFSYFASKEELVFPDAESRVQALLDALANRAPDDRPIDLLVRVLCHGDEVSNDIIGKLTPLRMRLLQTVPAVQGRALQIQFDAERRIAGILAEAFPDELDDLSARALTGAFAGAVRGASQAMFDRAGELTAEQRAEATRQAVVTTLAPLLKRD
ncbi:TetR/AcrR family transcriptional regulator [Amycolatopsis echigonensis]|uniref:TetR family transcriptional regulator n=1 Tax=Amycolatopsis echigonensis TaxID=2576905 RepID=A0A8E1W7Z3_9PSEU|nr:TetR/AcrR family transcriptional regulator [Amycolatopsis echigonensis]MBB2505840.1 TetR family transcriptional regulator [Amycolatopsis echigonensis]